MTKMTFYHQNLGGTVNAILVVERSVSYSDTGMPSIFPWQHDEKIVRDELTRHLKKGQFADNGVVGGDRYIEEIDNNKSVHFHAYAGELNSSRYAELLEFLNENEVKLVYPLPPKEYPSEDGIPFEMSEVNFPPKR